MSGIRHLKREVVGAKREVVGAKRKALGVNDRSLKGVVWSKAATPSKPKKEPKP